MLHDQIPCNVIHSVDFAHGTLYALSLTKPKTHVTLDGVITSLDSALAQAGGRGTNFVSITDVLSGKIKTFAAGEHARDEHFKAIFLSDCPGGGRSLQIHPGVAVWTPVSDEEAQGQHDVEDKANKASVDTLTVVWIVVYLECVLGLRTLTLRPGRVAEGGTGQEGGPDLCPAGGQRRSQVEAEE